MDRSIQILSDITIYLKYAKYIKEKKRRESWKELVTRNKEMHIKRYPQLVDEIEETYKYVYEKKILPSMRSLQFAGKPIEINNSRMFNCAYTPVDDWRVFSEIMFLLLGGTGVGFSVQKRHIDKLSEIRKPTRKRRYLVGDSIEGWADAVKVLMKAYFANGYLPNYDFSDIREKGAELVTSGGKAPGPEPLKDCLHNLQKILDRKENGEKLTSLEIHDIICYIADCVLAGGIRRAALISLFDIDDEEMLTCKYENWWELNPQRGRANNSAVVVRHKLKKDDFFALWDKIKNSGSGDPGFYLTNDPDMLCNPCAEASLRNNFCNLVTVNASNVESQEDLNERVKHATRISTWQSGYTDFHYLRDIWKRNTEKEALLGVSMTGIASRKVLSLDLKQAAKISLKENERIAKIIGVNKAARSTLLKPEGTASLVLGCSSGIHAWHAPRYIRRVRVGKNEAIYKYLIKYHPELVEDDYFKPHNQAVINVPQRAPDDAILRDESPIDLLERVKKFTNEWIKPAHRSGSNTHSVSCTVSVKENEWGLVGDWMWNNIEFYNCISILPYYGGTHIQSPFEDISDEEYNRLFSNLKDIDLTKVVEEEDFTDHHGEVACAGGACELI
jgi:ribonucleoside-triphosphate reductase